MLSCIPPMSYFFLNPEIFSSYFICKFLQDIIRLPKLFGFLQKPLAQFISVARASKSKEGYASIGGGSPLRQMTDAQVKFFAYMVTLFFNHALLPNLCQTSLLRFFKIIT